MKIFRLEEANAALASVRPLLEDVVRKRRDLAIAMLEADVARSMGTQRGGSSATATARDRARQLQRELVSAMEAVERHGCIIKDLDLGLVDFPALRGGRLVNLCWKLDEPSISFWHGVDEGFAARKSISRRRA